MPEQIDHIEELQKRLYARDPESIPKQKFGILRPVKQDVANAWGDSEIPKIKGSRRTSITGYKRFFLFALGFFLIGAGLAAFSFFRGAVTVSSKNVDLAILGNSFVAGGEELPLQVEIGNKNASDLQDTMITLEYPKGATDESGSEVARLTQELGTIGSGKTKSVAFSAILYGEQGLTRVITATLSYHLPGSTATFEKKQTFSVMISSSPVGLTVDGPALSASNQPFTLTIRSLFNGDQPLANSIVRVEYPIGFTFLSATPAPSVNNNVWSLGTLEKGQEAVITLKGKLEGTEGDEKAFRVYLGTPVSDTDSHVAVSFNSALHALTIEQPFIAAEIQVGGGSDDVVALPIGSAIDGAVSWRNTTEHAITNPTFTLQLSGEGIDTDSVKAINGYYDELSNTLTWNAASDEELDRIDPGESGTLLFSLSPKSDTARGDIGTSLSVEGMIPDQDNVVKTIADLDELTVRFAARLQFAAQSLYSIGPIKNTGPYPPKADQETSYTITWTVRPTDNPLTNVIATATLPMNATWGGVIVPQSEAVTFNPDTRQVRWNIGSLPRVSATPLSKSVSFQIKIKPTSSQVGDELPLLSETQITANDASANVPLQTVRPGLSTVLATDPAYSPGKEKVVP